MASEETPREGENGAKIGKKLPIAKKHKYFKWTDKRKEYLHGHPGMTARELARKLGCSESAVAHARHKYGRWDGGERKVCSICGERVIWEESEHASRLRLCKGCYLHEMAVRQYEDADANRVRQARMRVRRRGDGGR